MSEDVIVFLEEAIRLDPDNPAHYNNLSCVYSSRGNQEQALYFAQQALQRDPDSPVLCNNLGLQYRKSLEYESALECFERSVSLDANPYSLVNLGTAYLDDCRLFDAIDCLQAAIEINDDPAAHVALATCYFLMGDVRGREHYEYRLQLLPQLKAYVDFFPKEKAWTGQDLSGKRILVFCEQGYGDTIQHCRYFPALKQKGCEVIANCDSQLLRLLSSQPGVDRVISLHEVLQGAFKDYDFHVPSMSLPHRMNLHLTSLSPYIFARKFGLAYGDRFRVGICWKGNPRHKRDNERSIALSAFVKLAMPGVKLISLVKDPSPVEQNLMAEYDIADVSGFMTDFEETGRIIADLDLVISVDTAILHLAGALGIKSWGLLSFRPDFRWRLFCEHSPLYPRMRLFRQDTTRYWRPVMERVEQELLRVVELNRTCNSEHG